VYAVYMYSETLSWRLGLVVFKLVAGAWLVAVLVVFRRFSVLSYGTTPLSAADILRLRWRDSWDFILHRQWAWLNKILNK